MEDKRNRAPFFHLSMLPIERERRWRVNGRLFTYFTYLTLVTVYWVERPRHIAAGTHLPKSSAYYLSSTNRASHSVRPTLNNIESCSGYNLYPLSSLIFLLLMQASLPFCKLEEEEKKNEKESPIFIPRISHFKIHDWQSEIFHLNLLQIISDYFFTIDESPF